MTESRGNSPWKEMYERIGTEYPQNDVERQVLKMLGRGESIPDCLEYWKEREMDEESFLQFMKRADAWETEELRRNSYSQSGHNGREREC